MIDGAMQSFALTLDKFLAHAAKWSPHREVVTARERGSIERTNYAKLHARSLRISAVLETLGHPRLESTFSTGVLSAPERSAPRPNSASLLLVTTPPAVANP